MNDVYVEALWEGDSVGMDGTLCDERLCFHPLRN